MSIEDFEKMVKKEIKELINYLDKKFKKLENDIELLSEGLSRHGARW
ncbi:MAG: hypothetical protein JXA99_17230 [Candidatus Lokiarchaeota archaeon]|nr:hypothetical protein [Candidatus Lokiarchaeota archaeon]